MLPNNCRRIFKDIFCKYPNIHVYVRKDTATCRVYIKITYHSIAYIVECSSASEQYRVRYNYGNQSLMEHHKCNSQSAINLTKG